MRALLVALGLALLLCVAASAKPPKELAARDWRLYYWPGQEQIAAEAGQTADASLPRLRSILGLERAQAPRIDLYLVHTRAEFQQLTGGANPGLVLGEAFPEQNLVVVQPLHGVALHNLVAHELTHVLLADRVSGSGFEPPRWVHEGVAKYAANDFGLGDQALLTDAINTGKLVPLEKLEAAFDGPPEQVSLAYAEAYTLVDFLAKLDPQRGLAPFLEQMAAVGDVSRALVRAYNLTPEELAVRWKRALQTEYLGRSNQDSANSLIWGGLVVIFILAYLVQLRQRRHIRRRLDQEEAALAHHAHEAHDHHPHHPHHGG